MAACMFCGNEAHAIAHTVIASMRQKKKHEVVLPIGEYDDPTCFDNDRCKRLTKGIKGLQYVEVDGVVIHGRKAGTHT